ncbi:unnamed protein product [Durusdinium trenchii]|uniref:Transglutaminase-like domain-containing protein n=1 Tax=Durusdinium trenchii TaxID=1381693 RepID=A0ABP0LI15_9DINO
MAAPAEPAEAPAEALTEVPTEGPTVAPTEAPTEALTEGPTEVPTEARTEAPTEVPTEGPTEVPTEVPTEGPTEVPAEARTEAPAEAPTEAPTEVLTEAPTEGPTEVPTEVPTEGPTEVPAEARTEALAEAPTEVPAETPVRAVDCPGAHGLQKTNLGNLGRMCDLCSGFLPPGSISYACKDCGFDVCPPCMEPDGPRKNAMANKLLRYLEQTQSYADQGNQARAREVLPERFLEQVSDGSDAQDQLIDLLKWFKNDFFRWTDSPFCQTCSTKATKNEGFVEPTEKELRYGGKRVESWRCTGCDALLRFPRFNDAVHLLETRHGRCGEWANCFTLLLAALGFQARLVVDWTDHVWSEVRVGERWCHCDSCEAALDSPLMYECGWGKKLSYIIAFSAQEVVDVSPRYTQQWPQLLTRRQLLPEEELAKLVQSQDLLARSKSGLADPPWRSAERTELDSLQVARDAAASSAEQCGRSSGALEWRLERGECGQKALHPLLEDSDFLLLAGDTDDCDGTVMAELVSGAVVAQLGPSKCLDLQGDLAAVEMTPSHDAFLSEEGFTVEAWVFAKSEDLRAESFMNPIVSRHGPATGWELRLCRKGGLVFLITINGQHIELTTEGRPWRSHWIHLAGTFDGTTLRAYIAKELVGELEVGQDARSTRSNFLGPLCFGRNPAWRDRSARVCLHSAKEVPLEEADKEDLADTLKRRISSSRSEAATCAAKGDSSRMSRFCLVLLLGGDLLPEGRSFDSLGRPSEVAVAFQQLVQQYQTQLWSASANGELATVRRLLQQFQDPNGRDEQGESAIWKASVAGHVDVVELLLEASADPSAPADGGVTPLFAAAQNGCSGAVRSLLEAKVDSNQSDQHGRTPLSVAVPSWPQVVRCLLEAGADKDKATEDGRTPLFIAAESNHPVVAMMLLEAGAEQDRATEDGRTPLFMAAYDGNCAVVQHLLRFGAQTDLATEDGRTPLLIAAGKGYLDIVRSLLNATCDVGRADRYGHNALFSAAMNGNLAVVQCLLDAGAATHERGRSREGDPLIVAAENNHFDVVKALLEHGVADEKVLARYLLQVDTEDEDPLMQTPGLVTAAHVGHLGLVKILLEAGAPRDKADQFGRSPLFIAAGNGHLEMVETLLSARAVLNATDRFSQTPLVSAVHFGCERVVRCLLEAKAAWDKADQHGHSPLFIAAGKGNLKVVRALLDSSADKDQADGSGQTPLFIACDLGFLEIVQCLLGSAADPDKATVVGNTPLLIATERSHPEVVRCLLDAGADDTLANKDGQVPISMADHRGIAWSLIQSAEKRRRLGRHAEDS